MKVTKEVLKFLILYLWNMFGWLVPGVLFMGILEAIRDKQPILAVLFTVVFMSSLAQVSDEIAKKSVKSLEKESKEDKNEKVIGY